MYRDERCHGEYFEEGFRIDFSYPNIPGGVEEMPRIKMYAVPTKWSLSIAMADISGGEVCKSIGWIADHFSSGEALADIMSTDLLTIMGRCRHCSGSVKTCKTDSPPSDFPDMVRLPSCLG